MKTISTVVIVLLGLLYLQLSINKYNEKIEEKYKKGSVVKCKLYTEDIFNKRYLKTVSISKNSYELKYTAIGRGVAFENKRTKRRIRADYYSNNECE